MSRKHPLFRKFMIYLAIVPLFILTACQNYARDARELQNALLTGFETYSFNSSSALTLQLDLNETALAKMSEADKDVYRTFQEISVTLAEHTRKGPDQEYFLGALEIAGLIIPFEFERKGTNFVLWIDGAQKPIVFQTDARHQRTEIEVTEAEIGPPPAGLSRQSSWSWSPYFSGVAGAWLPQGTMVFNLSEYDKWRNKRIDEVRTQKLQALKAAGQIQSLGYGSKIAELPENYLKVRSALRELWKQLVRNAHLPSTSTVDETVIAINGKEERLTRLSVQADYIGLAEMLYGLFTNLERDQGALKAIAESLYDLTAAINESKLEQLREIDPDSEEVQKLQHYLGDRDAVIDSLFQELKAMVREGLSESNDSSGNGSSFLQQFALQYELYFRGSNGRAISMQMYLPLSDSNDSPLRGVAVSYAMARWNLNEEITVPSIDLSQGKLDFYQKDGGSPFPTPHDWISFFEPQSDFYQLMKKLHTGRVQFDFPVVNQPLSREKEFGSDGNRAFIENGVTLVPLRFVSEQLYTNVLWNGEKRQITIEDQANNRTIVLTIGSLIATVDGKPMQLQEAPRISPSGKTYVPIRFVAEALGAEVTWDGNKMRIGVIRE